MTENPSFLERLAALDPALVRAAIVAVFGVIVAITGSQVDNATVDLICNGVLALLALIAGIVIRPAVTPNAKVIAFKPRPIEDPEVIHPGEATIEATPEAKQELYEAGLRKAA